MPRGARRPDWATIPNAVTLLRFLLLVPVCVLLVDGGPDPLAVILLLVWALTDWVDGLLARALHQTSRIGAIIDPIADRLGLVGVVLSLALAGVLSWIPLGVIALVDIVLLALAGRTAAGGALPVSRVGKARTAVLMSAVFLLAAAAAWLPAAIPALRVLVWIGVLLHVIAGVGYLLSALRHRGGGEDRAPAWRR
ncbi:CDP-alcohol phosphatidyltransferase family protein [Brachybacterium kimchii]|uniref:CDP-alcohol phosphatidyltransferase family protein n=1 Tax=Brachybacterium kimchii TaxID=2942909 RepID=A0ABY4NCL8_9MICO|nr:CDP-alcohol phosphatidyltransferase family protein [Brachybacterium kimchii]UQN31219.1 CDP-alcohol phosphatidyltransferase family protein [Brachybacterium kimchii]